MSPLPPKPLPSFKRNSAASTGKAPQVHNGIVSPNGRYHPYSHDPRRTCRLTASNLLIARPDDPRSDLQKLRSKVSLWTEAIPRDASDPSIPIYKPYWWSNDDATAVLAFAFSQDYHPCGIHENPKGTLPENIALTVCATIQRYKVLQQPHIAAKFTEAQIQCRDHILRHLGALNERIGRGDDFTFVDRRIAIKLCVGLGKISFRGINKEQERIGRDIYNLGGVAFPGGHTASEPSDPWRSNTPSTSSKAGPAAPAEELHNSSTPKALGVVRNLSPTTLPEFTTSQTWEWQGIPYATIEEAADAAAPDTILRDVKEWTMNVVRAFIM
ncbi:uncharacterized protein LAESUDRAFT_761480 [Laetiporus sulphureus 93-53]|uniref:Uncharacterized protein n=1 Tax=Laetiporus sulphureus 93-53 TaxID=1314785 RepID=A0A165D0A2_9APHY|nr:uncharacterized protein LAESUDRAFT_761480 [Laetiporus sulphureus 93-53]KZT03877.1 hypothetical protein LAESUDRAFT_761480 [Laetiporus sulphureus 93-53]